MRAKLLTVQVQINIKRLQAATALCHRVQKMCVYCFMRNYVEGKRAKKNRSPVLQGKWSCVSVELAALAAFQNSVCLKIIKKL